LLSIGSKQEKQSRELKLVTTIRRAPPVSFL
jgi:hypothetical protein